MARAFVVPATLLVLVLLSLAFAVVKGSEERDQHDAAVGAVRRRQFRRAHSLLRNHTIPESVALRVRLGMLLGRFEDALADLRHLETTTTNTTQRASIGRQQSLLQVLVRNTTTARATLALSRPAEAYNLLSGVLVHAPEAVDLYLLRAQCAVGARAPFTTVLGNAAFVLHRDRHNTRALHLLGKAAYESLLQPQLALQYLAHCLEIDREHKECGEDHRRYSRVVRLFHRFETATARHDLRTALGALENLTLADNSGTFDVETRANICTVHHGLASALRSQGDKEELGTALWEVVRVCTEAAAKLEARERQGEAGGQHTSGVRGGVFLRRAWARMVREEWEACRADLGSAVALVPKLAADPGLSSIFLEVKRAVEAWEKEKKEEEKKARDYYNVLGVLANATREEIKKAYRALALQWHPDKASGDLDLAHEMFLRIAEAWEVLGDAELRRKYDAGLDVSKEASQARQAHHKGFNVKVELRTRDPHGFSSAWEQSKEDGKKERVRVRVDVQHNGQSDDPDPCPQHHCISRTLLPPPHPPRRVWAAEVAHTRARILVMMSLDGPRASAAFVVEVAHSGRHLCRASCAFSAGSDDRDEACVMDLEELLPGTRYKTFYVSASTTRNVSSCDSFVVEENSPILALPHFATRMPEVAGSVNDRSLDGGGWQLVLRVAPGESFPTDPNALRGIHDFGGFRDDPLSPKGGARKFVHVPWDEMLLATGNEEEWVVFERKWLEKKRGDRAEVVASMSSELLIPHPLVIHNNPGRGGRIATVDIDHAEQVVFAFGTEAGTRQPSERLHDTLGVNVFVRNSKKRDAPLFPAVPTESSSGSEREDSEEEVVLGENRVASPTDAKHTEASPTPASPVPPLADSNPPVDLPVAGDGGGDGSGVHGEGWALVMRTSGGRMWVAGAHGLDGRLAVGQFRNDPLVDDSFARPFAHLSWDEVRFSSGDGRHWGVFDRSDVSQHGRHIHIKARQSSASEDHTAVLYHSPGRGMRLELKDQEKSVVLYAEGNGRHSSDVHVLREMGGANAWIRFRGSDPFSSASHVPPEGVDGSAGHDEL